MMCLKTISERRLCGIVACAVGLIGLASVGCEPPQPAEEIAAVTFTPAAGTFTGSIDVTLASETSDASIRYTLDGSDPTSESGILYTGTPIRLTETTTIKAIAYLEFLTGTVESDVSQATYTRLDQVAKPTFNPGGTSFAESITVQITCSTVDAIIRYTTDGTNPSQTHGTSITSGDSVTLNSTTTLKAIAYKPGLIDSPIAEATYTKQAQPGQVAEPVFTPNSTTFVNSISVQITTSTPGAAIRYTTDGSTPSRSNGTLIASGDTVTLSATTTLKAIAYKDGMTDSNVNLATYTRLDQVAKPTFTPDASSFTDQINVQITCSTADATIRYTTDGSDPSKSHGTIIASGDSVTLTATTTLKAIAYKDGMVDSPIAQAVYTKLDQVAQPLFSPDGFSFASRVEVVVTCDTPGATIRYTTDGSDPSRTHGTIIASGDSVEITTTTTLKAIAYKDGLTDSSITQATYTKMDQVAQPAFSVASDIFLNSTTVQITCATPDATIRYATDGSTPSQTNGTIIANGASVDLTTTTTLKAIAYKTGMVDSAVKESLYIILEMVQIPAGTFQMGDSTGNGEANELPVHTVTISQPFYIGKYEITQIQWQAVMGSNPSNFKDGDMNRPVEQVSWDDCQAFITALSTRLGRTFRLPTEAEWEYACRAGSEDDYYFGNDASLLGDYAWYIGNSNFVTHPVGQKLPNAFGLYDMHGNVWEWCNDWYGPYAAGPETDPTGPGVGTERVLRGGSWFDYAENVRSAFRAILAPDQSNGNIGLRVVMDAP
ncbi:MAG TPA: chitobiase/beta-hexosaminidase C-terminal domain-containing protein [Phycisphaerae bacterium]|nr:chitobiase/beta-hexosaminidase C-terminal domain-containing protein [Phycisphaerae bacterium]